MTIPNYLGELPYVTTEQMIEVDRAMMEDVRYLADISVPPSLYAEPALALQVGPLFAESEILLLR